MKLLKIIISIIVAIAILLLLFTMGIVFFVDPNHYKDRMEQAVSSMTAQPVHIGHISWSFYPNLGIKLTQVKVGNTVDFGNAPLFSAENALVSIKLFPLLKKQIKFSRLSLQHWKLNLITNASIIKSTNAVLTHQTTVQQTTIKPTNDFSKINYDFNGMSINLQQGQINWHDVRNARNIQFKNVSLQSHKILIAHPFLLHLAADLFIDQSYFNSHIDMQGLVDSNQSKQYLVIKNLIIHTKGLSKETSNDWLVNTLKSDLIKYNGIQHQFKILNYTLHNQHFTAKGEMFVTNLSQQPQGQATIRIERLQAKNFYVNKIRCLLMGDQNQLTIKLKTNDGTLPNLNLAQVVKQIKDIIKTKQIMPINAGNQGEFSSLASLSTLQNGIATTAHIEMVAPDFVANGEGNFDLSQNKVHYQVNVLPNTALLDVDFKHMPIPLVITGSVSKLKVQPDFTKILQIVASQDINAKIQKVITDQKNPKVRKFLEKNAKKYLGQ